MEKEIESTLAAARSSQRRLKTSTYQIGEMYKSGMTMQEIASSLDCSVNAIQKRLKSGLIQTRSRKANRKLNQRINTERIIELYNEGKSVRSICAEFKCGFYCVTRRLVRAGILTSLRDSTIREKK